MSPPKEGYPPTPEAIDAFLSSLSPWGLLHLKRQLRSGDFPLDGLAGMPDLPPEIFCHIVPLLGLKDVLNCRLVSRQWHHAWIHGAVVDDLCRHFFPGLLEIQLSKFDNNQLFLGAARKHARRHLARPKVMTIPWNESNEGFFTDVDESALARPGNKGDSYFLYHEQPVWYNNGKVAWQPDKTQVIIDDLRTRRRRRCYFGSTSLSGDFLDLAVCSDKVLLFKPGRYGPGRLSSKMSIWHLESSEWKQLSLPATGVQYFAHGDMVAVKTAQGVVVWTWGGKVTEFEVNTPQLGDLPVGCEGAHSEWTLLFHPTRSDTLFSVRTYCHNESDGPQRTHTVHLIVVKHIFDGTAWQKQQPKTLTAHPGCEQVTCCMRCQASFAKISDRGLNSLLCLQPMPPWNSNCTCHGFSGPRSNWKTICFNTVTEAFVQLGYDVRRDVDEQPSFLTFADRRAANIDCGFTAWEDELLVRWSPLDDRGSVSYPGCLWKSFQVSERDGWSTNPEEPPGKWSFEETYYNKEHHLYGMDFTRSQDHTLFSDQDFVVGLTVQGLNVWSFCDDDNRPKSQDDESTTENRDLE